MLRLRGYGLINHWFTITMSTLRAYLCISVASADFQIGLLHEIGFHGVNPSEMETQISRGKRKGNALMANGHWLSKLASRDTLRQIFKWTEI